MNERMPRVRKGIEAVRRFLDPPLEPDAPPIEIRAAVIDAIERQVVVAGIGKRVFPYGAVSVDVLLSRPEHRAAFEVAFDDLDTRVRQRLRERRVELPATFLARATLLDEPPSAWPSGQRFAVEYAKGRPARDLPPPAPVPALHVTILKGTASRETYRFQSAVVLIGRTAAAVDARGRVRRNQVAFDQRSSTVSRAHARVVYDRERAEYRLLDEGSARGTRLVRGDVTQDVRPQREDSRGVRLESGDEIHVGDAVLRIAID